MCRLGAFTQSNFGSQEAHWRQSCKSLHMLQASARCFLLSRRGCGKSPTLHMSPRGEQLKSLGFSTWTYLCLPQSSWLPGPNGCGQVPGCYTSGFADVALSIGLKAQTRTRTNQRQEGLQRGEGCESPGKAGAKRTVA